MEHIEKVGDKFYNPELMRLLSQELKQDASDIVYKRVFGEEQTVQLGDNKYTLLPIGNINSRLQGILDGRIPRSRGTNSISGACRILKSKLEPITVKNANMEPIKSSYISHYKNVLGEEWSTDDFFNRLNSLSYRTYKYARDEKTGKIFIVGFFGAQIASGAGGKYLTNAELYVLPHFRGRGIATELVNQSFQLAHEDGIDGFDSLTYKVQGYNPLQFWRNIGANNTELYHISGSINEMINSMSRNSKAVKEENDREDK